MLFKFHFVVLGGHTHIRLFTGPGSGSLAKAGEFVLRNEEFKHLRDGIEDTLCQGASMTHTKLSHPIGHDIEFIEEEAYPAPRSIFWRFPR